MAHHKRLIVALGAIGVLALTVPMARRHHQQGYLVVTEAGAPLPSLFFGTEGLPKFKQLTHPPKRTEGQCSSGKQKPTTLLGRIWSFVEPRVLAYDNCPPDYCWGHLFKTELQPCFYQCNEEFYVWYYVDSTGEECHGWRYDGSTTCGNCEQCAQAGCDSCIG